MASPNQTGDLDSQSDNERSASTVLNKTEAKIALRKIDRRLVPIIGIMYCFSVIGRANLPAAAIAGMTNDLNLFGNRYVCLSDVCRQS
jgi:hypothetical protein